jgi:hypothetical protein
VALAANADGSRVFVSVSDGDIVVSVDTATRALAGSQVVSEPGLLDPGGSQLPGSSPTGLVFDAAKGQLWVARAADNAVSLFDTALSPLGAVPVGWYPTSVALADGGKKLVVTNGKGFGAGPLTAAGEESGKQQMSGSISLIDVPGLDLAATTAQVEANVRRPSEVIRSIARAFPVPTEASKPTPSGTSCWSCAKTRPTTRCSARSTQPTAIRIWCSWRRRRNLSARSRSARQSRQLLTTTASRACRVTCGSRRRS